ncbi:hypothetical protein AKO1_007951 [Acrasis kona]|uniref:Uncharacterized protein n=1 Tax=Acrasis kona TaxID=1008807 RepID=A0AAW2YQ29_9EUKA
MNSFDEGDMDEAGDLSFFDEQDFKQYLSCINTLESIHKVVQVQHKVNSRKNKTKTKPYLLSLRVVTPVKHPVSSETALLTTSNQTFSDGRPTAPHKSAANTVSLLAGITTNMHQLSGTLTYNEVVREGANSNKRDMAPRILLTYSNIKDELYECELPFDELSAHRKEMNLDKLTWNDYLKHLHKGLFLYFIQSEDNQEEEHVRIEFDDENAESLDLLNVTIMSPLIGPQDSSEPKIRLKYTFQLYAVRDATDYTNKIQTLVFDIATYSSNLYRTRVIDDKNTIEDLKRQLHEKKDQLQDANDRLSLYQPNANYNDDINKNNDFDVGVGGFIDDQQDDVQNAKKTSTLKRKAPKSLLNPAHKRRTTGKGAKIQ